MPACDRSPQTHEPNADFAGPSGAGPFLVLTTVAPLRPLRQTHFAVDSVGNVLWVQESESGDAGTSNDVVYMLSSVGAVPQATRLTSANILTAMNAPRDGASGSIQSIASAPDGGVLFYFTGGNGGHILCCIGWFVPRTSEIRILADTSLIQKSSGMVSSLALARGQLFTAGGPSPQMWLWLRHSDGSAMLQFASQPLTTPLELTRPFKSITADADGHELLIAGEACRLRAGPGVDDLMLVDLLDGAFWRINAADASAKLLWSLVGLPRDLSSPVSLPDGRTILFAADARVIKERTAEQIAQPIVQTDFPALLLFSGKTVEAIPRDRIRAYAGFPVYQLQLTEFVEEKPGRSWITYDRNSGELLRAAIE